MLTPYDYGVIVFYFLFMLGMGWLTKRFIRSTSDYFRGGGQMLWWLVGSSAFMAQFSAWTFTGAASKAYNDGWPILVIYFGNALGFFMNAAYFAPRSRQMRIITAIEAARLRFSAANEQVFTWLQVPLGTLYAGIWLNGLCVFLAAAFGFGLQSTIVITGVVVVIVTLFGGKWAATAADFIQVLILMPVTLVAAFLALREIGGFGAFLDRIPHRQIDVGSIFDSNLLLLWVVAILVKQYISTNNLLEGSRYLSVKDSRNARKAALLAGILFLIGPVVWFLPPMIASILYPGDTLHQIVPGLTHPAEGAFIAICMKTMPQGMIGLLICGIMAATISSMDSGLNRNAGIFVKSFYHAVVRPRATDAELVTAGKITTGTFGVLVILAALNFSRLHDLGLFDLMLRFGTLIAVPYTVPLVLCVFVKRTPAWSGWSTVIVGLIVSYVVTSFFDPAWLERTFHLAPLAPAEQEYWVIGIGLFAVTIISSAWFFATMLFWDKAPDTERRRISEFYDRSLQPVDFHKEEGAGSDSVQARLLGLLCLCYGAFITLLAAIPNSSVGRACFVFCGLVVVAIGVGLRRAGRARPPAPAPAR